MKPLSKYLRELFSLGAIVGSMPNQIANGQAIDAVPAMANWNFIKDQINANVPPLIPSLGALTNFTPTLAFGGASVGVTYGSQVGRYWLIGGMLFFWLELVLTAKGASAGAATIGGLPIAVNAALTSSFLPCTITTFDVDYTIGGVGNTPLPTAKLVPGSANIALGSFTKAAIQFNITDLFFNNDSAVRLSGAYPT